MSVTLALAVAAGCSDPFAGLGAGPLPDTGGPAPAPLESVAGGDDPGLAPWLFGLDAVNEIDLTIGEDAWKALAADPSAPAAIEVRVNGERFSDVQATIGGTPAAYREVGGKSSYLLTFPRTCYGLRSLSLDNLLDDPSFVREAVAYAVYAAAGVPAPRVGYAWLTLNGDELGLYADVEVQDDRFLERTYDDPDGNLYLGEAVVHGDGSSTPVDFAADSQDLLSLVSGTDVDHADVHAVTEGLEAACGTGGLVEAVDALIAWDALFRYRAAETWVGQWNGYDHARDNWMVYFDPTEGGRAVILPRDHQQAFEDAVDWTAPTAVLGACCAADETCDAAFEVVLDEVCDLADAVDLQERVDEVVALIAESIEADPNKEVDAETVAAAQDAVRAWGGTRSAALRRAFDIPVIRADTVGDGELAVFDSISDLDLLGSMVAAWDLGGAGLEVGGLDFTAADPTGLACSGNVPLFDSDDASLNAVETLVYDSSCADDADLTLEVPIEAGVEHRLQLMFFEPQYTAPGYRKVDVLVEGEVRVAGLDTSTGVDSSGILYTLDLVPTDDSLDVVLRNVAEFPDPILSALTVERSP